MRGRPRAEVDGSIVRPASANGVVGLKPTVGLVSRRGVIGVAEPQDTVGPIARNVTDVAKLMNVIAGSDPQDARRRRLTSRRAVDYCDALRVDALAGARLGVARECFSSHEGTRRVIERAIELRGALGAQVIDPVTASSLPFFGPLERELFQFGVKENINAYLRDHSGAQVANLDELIEFNRRHADEVMPYFQQEFLEMARELGPGTAHAVGKFERSCAAWRGATASIGRWPNIGSTRSLRRRRARQRL
ncbi:MAG: amidase family protein [Pirellulales bacterium]